MNDLRQELSRAARNVSPPHDALQRMFERRERRRRNERLGAAALAITVAVAVIGGGLFSFARGRGEGQRPGDGPRLAMRPGEYSYVKLVEIQHQLSATAEAWWGLDGSGRIRASVQDDAPNDERGYGDLRNGTYGPGEFPVEADASGLSTDPRVLKRQLQDRSAPGGASPQPEITPSPGVSAETGALWRAINQLLFHPNVTPELRVALFEVAQGLPNVEREEGVQDPVGRDAVVLRTVAEGTRDELFFDPGTRLWMASVQNAAVGSEGGGDFPIYRIVATAGFTGSTEDTPREPFFPPPARDLPRP